MGTTFSELRRQVLIKLKNQGGEAVTAAEQAINEAHKVIARVQDFDELMTLDTANAVTVANQSLYHLETDLGLTRPKDVYTIRYMDEENSRKLDYVSPTVLDQELPYPLSLGTGDPTKYTQRGMYLELVRVPNTSNKSLYIYHSQWPATLSNDSDTTPYRNIDDVITTLAAEIAESIISKGFIGNWTQRAQALLGSARGEEITKPDQGHVARPFNPYGAGASGNYWIDPFVKEQP